MEEKREDYRVVGTITGLKGECTAGHKVEDQFELSSEDTASLCGLFYHGAFPYILMLQFGGGFPPDAGDPDVIVMDCMDHVNVATIELKRIRE
jgi:uncharacterized repeat protein (TIGR04076 family)